jgi:hypothetical protein
MEMASNRRMEYNGAILNEVSIIYGESLIISFNIYINYTYCV